MKKRIVSLFLILCLSLSLGSAALATEVADHEYWKIWSQKDERWGHLSISASGSMDSIMKNEGCLITALTKVFIHSGQQDPETFTPDKCLEAMLKYGMLTNGGALYSGFRMNTNGMLATLAPDLYYIPDSPHQPWDQKTAYDYISSAIAQNKYIMIRAYNYDTGNYHYMAIDRAENGTVYVMDNDAILDLYSDNNYGGVSQTLCFQYNGDLPYPARESIVASQQPADPPEEEGKDEESGSGETEDAVPPVQDEGLLKNFSRTASYADGMFKDVKQGQWYYDGVANAYETGLMNGVSADMFGTGTTFSVAAAITVASRLHSIYHNGSADFEQKGVWYTVYVDYALDHGIMKNGQFDDYNRAATRAEMAQLMSAALPDEALEQINDIPLGSIPILTPTQNIAMTSIASTAPVSSPEATICTASSPESPSAVRKLPPSYHVSPFYLCAKPLKSIR